MTKSATELWMDVAGRYPLLCETTTLRLIRKLQDKNATTKARRRALDRICLHNLRLVVTTVDRIVGKSAAITWHSDVVADLLQQGYFGLRRAAEKFDLSKKLRFATYATIWINQAVGRFKAANSTIINVPERVKFDVWHWRTTGEMRKHGGRDTLSPKGHVLAAAAMYPVAMDAAVTEDGSPLSDMVSDENRLWHSSTDYTQEMEYLASLLREAKVEPKVQVLVMAYARKGNLQMSAAQAGVHYRSARKLLNAAVEKVQALV